MSESSKPKVSDSSKPLSRRKFLVTAGAAGVVAFGGGLGLSALSRPPQQVAQTATTTATSVATTSAQPTSIAISDMYGRGIAVPTTINRVLTCGPIEMEAVYMIAPDKLAGLPFTWNGGTSDPSGLPPLVPDPIPEPPGGWRMVRDSDRKL